MTARYDNKKKSESRGNINGRKKETIRSDDSERSIENLLSNLPTSDMEQPSSDLTPLTGGSGIKSGSGVYNMELNSSILNQLPKDKEMDPADYEQIKGLPGNDLCIECDAFEPLWGSVNFGILFCSKCSNIHRGLGVHISFVRSVTMDEWKPKHIETMKAGGNKAFKDFFIRHYEEEQQIIQEQQANTQPDSYEAPLVRQQQQQGGYKTGSSSGKEWWSEQLKSSAQDVKKEKYFTRTAEWYKQILQAKVDGTVEPTEMPLHNPYAMNNGDQANGAGNGAGGGASSPTSADLKNRIQGMGSAPIPNDESLIMKYCCCCCPV